MQGYSFKHCEIASHSQFDKAIICISDICTSSSRIACAKCVQEFHSDHAYSCLMMEDLLDGKLQQLPQASSELSDKIGHLKRLIEDTGASDDRIVDETFDEFGTNLIKTLEIERLSLKERYRQKQSLYGDMIQELISKFQDVNSTRPIIDAWNSFLDGTINNQEFNKQLTDFLQGQERSEKRQLLVALYQNCLQKLPNINQEEVNYLKEKIQQELEKVPELVRIPGNWYFVAPQINNYNNNLKPKEGGTVVEFGTQDSQQYVYGSMQLKSPGYYTWTFKFEEINQGMSYNTVYVGIVLEGYKEDLNQMFSYGKCVYLDINNNAYTQYLTPKANKKQMGQLIKENTQKKKPTYVQFILDAKKSVVTIQDSEDNAKYEYSKKILKKQGASQQNNYNFNQHLGFFKQGNGYRPFIMNYSGCFKVTIV